MRQRNVPVDLTAVLLLLLSLALSRTVRAQGADERFQWDMKHQHFLTKYVNEHPPDAPLSPAKADAYFQTVKEVWEKEVGEQASNEPYKARVSPYLYYWVLGPASLDEQTRCHLFAEYMVPTFLDDIARFKATPEPGPLYPVRAGIDFIVNTGVFRCEAKPEQWADLRSALEQLPDQIVSYLDQYPETDDQIKVRLQDTNETLRQIRGLLDVKDALYESRRDAAFASLAAASTQGALAGYLVSLGNELWRSYAAAGEAEKALATLDLLARSLTAGDLPRDSLRTWYEKVDLGRGTERFEQMTGAANLPVLVPSKARADLSGQFTDLTTGAIFDFSELEGRTVLFDFWATWCAPCIEEIPELKEFVANYGDDVILVSISGDAVTGGKDRQGVEDFMEKHGVTYTVLYDDPEHSLAERFGVVSWPSKFFVNEKGEFLKPATDEGRSKVTLEEARAYLNAQK